MLNNSSLAGVKLHLIMKVIAMCITVVDSTADRAVFFVKSEAMRYSHYSERILVKSAIECCAECSRDAGCVIVSYHRQNNTCQLSDESPLLFGMTQVHSFLTDEDWVVFFNAEDDCSTNTCQNGGTCSDGIGQYACACLPGWTDSDCTADIDECSSQPCMHGGVCENLQNRYECECLSGFEGTNCEINMDECASNPCNNGGTCVNGVNSFTCTCTSTWTGDRCNIGVCTSGYDYSPTFNMCLLSEAFTGDRRK